jgi:hypothetical protein
MSDRSNSAIRAVSEWPDTAHFPPLRGLLEAISNGKPAKFWIRWIRALLPYPSLAIRRWDWLCNLNGQV